MNNLEAKLILRSYRPGGEDAADPLFREALEQVERDPELKKWFAREMALETRIQDKLRAAAPIPTNLKANLLALRRTRLSPPWWLKSFKLAMATSAAVLMALALLHFAGRRNAAIESFQQAMTHCSLQHQGHVTYEPRDLSKIEGWLQGNGVATNFDLPPELQAIGAQGCRVIDWNQQKVTMICFVSKNRDQHLDLFIMDNAGRFFPRENDSPHFAVRNGLVTASWARNGKLYLLAGENRKSVQDVIQSI